MTLFCYPYTAKVDKVIAKNKFYQQGNANHRIERLFVEQVDSIRWAYKLSSQTINLADSQAVKEIQIFTLVSRVAKLDTEILQFIDKAIPSAIIFEIIYQDKIQVVATYKRQSQANSQKLVLGKYYASEWQNPSERRDLPLVLDMANLYEFIIEQLLLSDKNLSVNLLSTQSPTPSLASPNYASIGANIGIEQKIVYAEKVVLLNKQIQDLQKRIYKEKQFNRQVEMNLQLQTLLKQLKKLNPLEGQ